VPITYPLSLPSVATVGFERFELNVRNVVSVSQSPFTGQQQTYDFGPTGGAWWELRFRTTPMFSRADADPWIAWVEKLKGRRGSFLAGDPLRTSLRGVGGGTPLVNGSNAIRSATLAVKGLPNSTANVWREGDLIQIGTGTAARLYRVMTDTTSDGSGLATVDIHPPLRTTYANNTAIVVSAPVGVFRLTDNSLGYAMTPPYTHESLAISAVEAL
jgi:hypothetical protein